MMSTSVFIVVMTQLAARPREQGLLMIGFSLLFPSRFRPLVSMQRRTTMLQIDTGVRNQTAASRKCAREPSASNRSSEPSKNGHTAKEQTDTFADGKGQELPQLSRQAISGPEPWSTGMSCSPLLNLRGCGLLQLWNFPFQWQCWPTVVRSRATID